LLENTYSIREKQVDTKIFIIGVTGGVPVTGNIVDGASREPVEDWYLHTREFLRPGGRKG
jgi:hypothetical protein